MVYQSIGKGCETLVTFAIDENNKIIYALSDVHENQIIKFNIE